MSTTNLPGFEWLASDGEVYLTRLDLLPPAGFRGGMFLFGEPRDLDGKSGSPRYDVHRHAGGKYSVGSRPITKAELYRL